MTSEGVLDRADDALRGMHRRNEYNAAEQRFSLLLQERLQELLEGRRNSLALLRRYPADGDRLGVMLTPPDLDRDQLRLPVVESLTWDAVDFVSVGATGGPVSQEVAPDGSVTEHQLFSTRFPHIVVERTDRYVEGAVEPEETTWSLRRVQNQRAQTQVNRFLDAANLALELLRIIR